MTRVDLFLAQAMQFFFLENQRVTKRKNCSFSHGGLSRINFFFNCQQAVGGQPSEEVNNSIDARELLVGQSRLHRFFGGQNNAAPEFPNGLMDMNAVRRFSSQVLEVPYCQQPEDDHTGQPVRRRSWRPDMQLACGETSVAGYPNGLMELAAVWPVRLMHEVPLYCLQPVGGLARGEFIPLWTAPLARQRCSAADREGACELANGDRFPIQETNPFQGRNRAVENACRCSALPQLPINR